MNEINNNHETANGTKPVLPDGVRVLVACEESQATTIQLRKLGFDAWSCAMRFANTPK